MSSNRWTYSVLFAVSCHDCARLGLDLVDRGSGGVQRRKPEIETSSRWRREWRLPVFDQDRPPVGNGWPLRWYGRELRNLVPVELIGVPPARDQCPRRRVWFDACPGDAYAVLADELDWVARGTAAGESQRRLGVDAVGAVLHEHGATGRHAWAPNECDGSRQGARLLQCAKAGRASVRADEVRVGNGLQRDRCNQAEGADECEDRTTDSTAGCWRNCAEGTTLVHSLCGQALQQICPHAAR